jgi:hypothetical protein
MYVDTNSLPENFDVQQLINMMKQPYQQGGVFIDNTDNNTSYEPYINPYGKLEERLNKLELENKFLKLKLLGMEGKFSQDEIKNIRAMLMSNDESSITLAETIIETA